MERELDALVPLPRRALRRQGQAHEPCQLPVLVRVQDQDYSVPVAYGHRDVLARGYVGEVVISKGSEVIVAIVSDE